MKNIRRFSIPSIIALVSSFNVFASKSLVVASDQATYVDSTTDHVTILIPGRNTATLKVKELKDYFKLSKEEALLISVHSETNEIIIQDRNRIIFADLSELNSCCRNAEPSTTRWAN